MRRYSVIRKGSEHKVFCEDFAMMHSLTNRYFVGCVFDGCSSGIDSHFASVVFAKAMRKAIKQLPWSEIPNIVDELERTLIYNFINHVKEAKDTLKLNPAELLSTALVLIYDNDTKEVSITAFGDGVIVVDEQEIVVDQNNMPNYLTYHLSENNTTIYNQASCREIYREPYNIAIATDGILSYVGSQRKEQKVKPLDFLLHDEYLHKNSAMLSRKCNILANKHNYVHTDDLAIIRLMSQEVIHNKENAASSEQGATV